MSIEYAVRNVLNWKNSSTSILQTEPMVISSKKNFSFF